MFKRLWARFTNWVKQKRLYQWVFGSQQDERQPLLAEQLPDAQPQLHVIVTDPVTPPPSSPRTVSSQVVGVASTLASHSQHTTMSLMRNRRDTLFSLVTKDLKELGASLTVELLLEKGFTEKDIKLLLHKIVADNDEPIDLSALLKLNRDIINPYALNEIGLTPLQVAVKLSRWDYVCAIIEADELDHKKARSGYALLVAAQLNLTEQVIRIARTRFDLDFQSAENGYTAMHWFVINKNEKLLEFILSEESIDCDLNNTDLKGRQPIELSLGSELNEKLLRLFWDRDANIERALFHLAKEKQFDKTIRLLNIHKKYFDEVIIPRGWHWGSQDYQPLCTDLIYFAYAFNNENFLRDLLKLGADPMGDYRDNERGSRNVREFFDDRQYRKYSTVGILICAINDDRTRMVEIIIDEMNDERLRESDSYQVREVIISLIGKQALSILQKFINRLLLLDLRIEVYASDLEVLLKRNLDDIYESIISNYEGAKLQKYMYAAISDKLYHLLSKLCSNRNINITNAIEYSIKNKYWVALKVILRQSEIKTKTALTPVVALAAAAAKERNWELVELIVETLTPDNINHFGCVLRPIIMEDRDALLGLLMARGLNPDKFISDLVGYATSVKAWKCLKTLVMDYRLDADIHGFGDTLLQLMNMKKWDLVEAIIEKTKDFNYCYEGGDTILSSNFKYSKTAGDTIISTLIFNNQFKLLEKALIAGANPNILMRPESKCELQYAEQFNIINAATLLRKYGAHTLLTKAQRLAYKSDWEGCQSALIEYDESDVSPAVKAKQKKVVLNCLLYIAGQQNNKYVFSYLIEAGADASYRKGKSLLLHLIECQSWSCLSILGKRSLLTSYLPHDIHLAYRAVLAISVAAPPEIIQLLSETVDITTLDNEGYTCVIRAIMSDQPESLRILLDRGARVDEKSEDGELPITILLKLSKAKQLKHADKMSLMLTQSEEWVVAQSFENNNENLMNENVVASRNFCIMALERRYPKIDTKARINEYTEYLSTLTGEYNEKFSTHGKYRLQIPEIEKLVALVWVAANDRCALPETVTRFKDSEDYEKRVESFIESRKLSLAEKLYEASQVVKTQGSCIVGTMSKVIEALQGAHPDVYIAYGQAHIENSARHHAIPLIQERASILFNSLNDREQRVYIQEELSDSDITPKFYHILSLDLEALLTPLYGKILSEEKLRSLISPDAIRLIVNLPILSEISNLFEAIDALVKKADQSRTSTAECLHALNDMKQKLFTNESGHTLEIDFNIMKQEYHRSSAKIDHSLSQLSLFGSSENSELPSRDNRTQPAIHTRKMPAMK